MSEQGSDPLSNPEIEDVLSSIRRLVSEDTRGAPKRAVPPEPETAPMASMSPDDRLVDDRLVLTPSLRVEETGSETAAIARFSEANATNAATDESRGEAAPATADHSLEATIAELEAAVAEADDDFEPDGGDDDAILDEAGDDRDSADAATSENVAEPESGAEPVTESETKPLQPQQEAASVTADAADPGEADADEVADPDETDELAALDALDAEQDNRFDDDDLEAEALAGDIAAGLADDLAVDTDAGERSVPGGDTDADVLAAVTATAASTAFDEIEADTTISAARAGSGHSGRIDEAALRRLVSECLRQELQGPLGERITRNVRKLVRREIQRALAAKDID